MTTNGAIAGRLSDLAWGQFTAGRTGSESAGAAVPSSSCPLTGKTRGFNHVA
ncbi:hypothetical protein J2X43_001134 [Rhizobium sp. BE258]|nr:hypothetical protein [Rhizobium sp. BE258]